MYFVSCKMQYHSFDRRFYKFNFIRFVNEVFCVRKTAFARSFTSLVFFSKKSTTKVVFSWRLMAASKSISSRTVNCFRAFKCHLNNPKIWKKCFTQNETLAKCCLSCRKLTILYRNSCWRWKMDLSLRFQTQMIMGSSWQNAYHIQQT